MVYTEWLDDNCEIGRKQRFQPQQKRVIDLVLKYKEKDEEGTNTGVHKNNKPLINEPFLCH